MPDQIIDAVMARSIQADAVRTHPLAAWVIVRDPIYYPGDLVARLVTDGLTQGGADVITDFSSGDLVYLSGYGQSASSLLNNAVSSGGATTITLSDATQVTFLHTSVAGLAGRLFSV